MGKHPEPSPGNRERTAYIDAFGSPRPITDNTGFQGPYPDEGHDKVRASCHQRESYRKAEPGSYSRRNPPDDASQFHEGRKHADIHLRRTALALIPIIGFIGRGRQGGNQIRPKPVGQPFLGRTEALGFFVILRPALDKRTDIREKEGLRLGRLGSIPGSEAGTIPVQRR
jgi:hypothetical protein